MKIQSFILCILISTICSFNLRHTKQQYNSYVLAIQWPNGVCINGCNNRDSVVEPNTLTIHGLWPSNLNGVRLADCATGKTIKDDGSELFHRMKKLVPVMLQLRCGPT